MSEEDEDVVVLRTVAEPESPFTLFSRLLLIYVHAFVGGDQTGYWGGELAGVAVLQVSQPLLLSGPWAAASSIWMGFVVSSKTSRPAAGQLLAMPGGTFLPGEGRRAAWPAGPYWLRLRMQGVISSPG